MKISENLPQFNNQKALFIVAGKQEAVFYFVADSQAEELKRIRLHKPKYSDKEGYFQRKGRGRIFGSGSVLETKNRKLRKDFIKELNNNLQDILGKRDVEEIYLFSPSHMMKSIKKSLPASAFKKLKQSYKGNYCEAHIFKILKKLEAKPKIIIPKSKEALKLLKRFRV